MKRKTYLTKIILVALLSGCTAPVYNSNTIPSLDYARSLGGGSSQGTSIPYSTPQISGGAKVSFADTSSNGQYVVPQVPQDSGIIDGYARPLPLGDSGVRSSLWRESSNGADFFKDNRAWKPMDLITILISESAEGSKEADTETKSNSSLLASVQNFLGLETAASERIRELSLANTLQASTQNQFKGEGETTRKDSLKATISAMVVEVLPSGIIRVEGRKIIAVNNEEQTMVISGLVRPRDIDAINQVESSRIANMRIDYFGQGVVSDKQNVPWMLRTIDKIWPF